MYTFSQLVVRNILIGLIFNLLAAFFILFNLHSFYQEDTTKHQKVLSFASAQFLQDQNKQSLGLLLRDMADYTKLDINSYSGISEYSFQKASGDINLPFLFPELKQYSNKELDIVVKFQLDYSASLALTLNLIGLLFVLSNIFIVVASFISNAKNKIFFQTLSLQIRNDLSSINTNSANINQMLDIPELKEGISEIKDIIDAQKKNSTELEKEAYIDPLTQLSNRGRFVQFFENEIIEKETPIKFGVLIITRCSELQTINQIHGYREGDNYIANIAEIYKKLLVNMTSAKLYRLNSSSFACILPNMQLKQAEAFAQDLSTKLNEYQQAAELDSVAYSGLVYFDKSKPLGELLALADTGISVAQTKHINAWYSQTDTDVLQNNSINYGNQNWRQEIDSVVENQRISLLLQPIHPNGANSRVYGEVLARFLNTNEEMLPTASFIAMAEKLGKIVAVDRLIIETTISQITQKNMTDQSFGINLSSRSINDEQFLIWLERRLLRDASIASRLIFEITENGLQQNIKTSKRFIDMIHRVGSRVTVERFGVGLTSFKFFRDLKPDFIKMDSTYTRDIDEDKNNQYFLRLMVDLAHRLSISVLAESVESQEEKHTLSKLFIDGCQGFYVGKPSPL